MMMELATETQVIKRLLLQELHSFKVLHNHLVAQKNYFISNSLGFGLFSFLPPVTDFSKTFERCQTLLSGRHRSERRFKANPAEQVCKRTNSMYSSYCGTQFPSSLVHLFVCPSVPHQLIKLCPQHDVLSRPYKP